MIPVDLAHADRLTKAVDVAAAIAGSSGARLLVVGVTANTPTAIAHNPEEFGRKLREWASGQGARLGLAIEAKTVTSHDPAVDLDATLERQIEEERIDLVVMASHVPGFADYLRTANAIDLAAHTDTSVFIVR